jgi:hypothetical protein
MNTNSINKKNVDSVRMQINKKNGTSPYYATSGDSSSTDMDSFPYHRFFRGQYNSVKPIVFEREAGFRPIDTNCYAKNIDRGESRYPNHCFQVACSTVYPCYPDFEKQYGDKEQIELLNNRACVVEYR